MISFFRKIRQSLLSQNRVTRYLAYAIGEIFLVVIGILIALQINNWNEQRKLENIEQEYLTALKKEFENNLIEVDRVIRLNSRILERAKKVASYVGSRNPAISEKEFGVLFFNTVNSEVQYSPGSGVINEIISSGKLNIFRNEELKNALASMDGLLLQIRYQENQELDSFRRKLITFSLEKGNVRRMAFDAFGESSGLEPNKFSDNNLDLLESKEFDNLLTGFILSSGYLGGRYVILKNEIQNLIRIVEAQIEEKK